MTCNLTRHERTCRALGRGVTGQRPPARTAAIAFGQCLRSVRSLVPGDLLSLLPLSVLAVGATSTTTTEMLHLIAVAGLSARVTIASVDQALA